MALKKGPFWGPPEKVGFYGFSKSWRGRVIWDPHFSLFFTFLPKMGDFHEMPTFHARFCSKMDQKGVILGQKWGPKTTLFSVFSIRVLGLTGPNSGVKSGTTFWSEPVKNPFLSLFFTFFHFFSCFFRPSFLEVMDRLLLPCEFFSYFGVF